MNVYIVLRTGYFDEHDLRSYLSRLSIVLDARVVNSNPDSHDGHPQHETIFSGSMQDSEGPRIIIRGSENDTERTDGGYILVVWKMSVFLSRTLKIRLQGPSVVFSAIANLKPPEQVDVNVIEDEYLPSMVPSGINLLESFSHDQSLGDIKPRLSALRVSRVIPTNHADSNAIRPIKSVPHSPIRVLPALSARVRYARPYGTPSNFSIVASLDIDISPYINSEVVLEKVDFSISEGVVKDLNAGQGMVLPMTCRPRDDVTLLYRAYPDELETSKSHIKSVDIIITADVHFSPVCTPRVTLRWATSIDFTVPINPTFNSGAPGHTIQRDHRPAQLSISSNHSDASTAASLAVSRPDALPAIELTTRHHRSSSVPDFGVTMTFTAPATCTISPGKPFTWEVFIVNRSDRPRRLALVVVPRRRRAERIATNRPPSTSYGHKDIQVAAAVMDENILHALQKNSAVEPVDILCLSTDVRIGPLAPSACHTVEIKFLALKAGVFSVEAVRVVDLGTQEHVDIRDLPSILVSAS